jgi:hypothetical protein
VRLALHPTSETGHRAGRILLAEPGLEALGVYGHRSPATEERRATAITSLAGFTVLATDDAVAPLDLAAIAVDDGLSCVLAADTEPGPALAARFATRGLSLLVAASLPGLAEALAHRAEAGGSGALLLAWTRQGKPGPRQVPVPFPEPVGARWGSRLPARPGDPPGDTRVEVTLEGPWAGALARVTSGTGRKRQERLVAVADDRLYLEAIALAAGALLLAGGGAPPGAWRPRTLGAAYLTACLGVGLEVAGLGRRV